MSNRDVPITQRYNKWEQIIEKSARKTIGKTTYKPFSLKPSQQMQILREQRREKRREFEAETNPTLKVIRLEMYRSSQEDVKQLALIEEQVRTKERFKRMTQAGVNGFWKERKVLSTDQSGEWLIYKNDDGKRIMDPEKCKNVAATHYERLYAKGPVTYHPNHSLVKEDVKRWSEDKSYGGFNDAAPSKAEIKEVISNKKNNKATTDWKNEILKRGGDEMVDLVYPVILAFWEEETPPLPWNQGIITSVWKGKGDREKMENQRGITVSSSIGTIAEEILTNRLMQSIQFSQSQAGGKPGGSTTDQVFILKSIISLSHSLILRRLTTGQTWMTCCTLSMNKVSGVKSGD